MDEILKECGLVGFIVVGGPDPKCSGDLMIMSCILFTLPVSRQRFLIVSRAQSGSTKLGLNFSQVHGGWKTQIEEPFISYINNVFSASPLFFFMLTSINSHPAREMCQAVALPGPSVLSAMAKDQCHQLRPSVNSDATKFTYPEKELDEAEDEIMGLDFEDLIRMSDDENSEREGSVD